MLFYSKKAIKIYTKIQDIEHIMLKSPITKKINHKTNHKPITKIDRFRVRTKCLRKANHKTNHKPITKPITNTNPTTNHKPITLLYSRTQEPRSWTLGP